MSGSRRKPRRGSKKKAVEAPSGGKAATKSAVPVIKTSTAVINSYTVNSVADSKGLALSFEISFEILNRVKDNCMLCTRPHN